MRGGLRAWRALATAAAIPLLGACASPSGPPAAAPPAPAVAAPATDLPESARPVFEVFDAIDRDYVTALDFARLRLSAVHALAAALPAERYTVTETPAGIHVEYAPTGAARASLTLAGAPTARETALDVGRAVDAAAAVAPGVKPAERNRLMLARVLRELDPESGLIEAPEPSEAIRGDTGIVLGRRGDGLMAVEVNAGSPAAAAGVQPGDRIVSVSGVDVHGQRVAFVNARLRGPVGSRVVVGVQGPGAAAPRQVELTRAPIAMPILVPEDVGGGIVRLALRRFSGSAPRLLAAALDERAPRGLRAVVLDLRDDPGGLLTAAVEVAELFLEPRRLVSYTEGRVRSSNMRFTARARGEGKPGYLTEPLAVLVNEESGGAAEIVAAALQDWGRATVVGAKTAGHGSIQKIVDLSSGASIKLTNAFFFTPKGHRIQDRGVTPDELVPSVADLRADPPLRRAIELLEAKLPNA